MPQQTFSVSTKKQRVFLRTVSVISAMVVMTACGMLLKPNANVQHSELGFEVKNMDKTTWKDCRFILNKEAGADNQYVYDAGNIEGEKTMSVLTAQFTKPDGTRFIPFMTKAKHFEIKCAHPAQPYSLPLD